MILRSAANVGDGDESDDEILIEPSRIGQDLEEKYDVSTGKTTSMTNRLMKSLFRLGGYLNSLSRALLWKVDNQLPSELL